MIRNNLLNFTEFERETFFYQGGKMYYDYDSERRKVNGKTGSVLVPSEQAESVRIAFQIYQNPECSLKDIIEYFKESDIVKIKTDKDIYACFQSMGYEIMDGISACDGVYGVFSHKDSDKRLM